MSVELPRDAEGREIPLDTKVLYDRRGNEYEVAQYIYRARPVTPRRTWDAKMLDGTIRYTTSLRLTPPDSWKKLEEDLDSCSASTRYIPCAYFNKSSNDCKKCLADPNKECLVQMVKHIALRIHKLRGED